MRFCSEHKHIYKNVVELACDECLAVMSSQTAYDREFEPEEFLSYVDAEDWMKVSFYIARNGVVDTQVRARTKAKTPDDTKIPLPDDCPAFQDITQSDLVDATYMFAIFSNPLNKKELLSWITCLWLNYCRIEMGFFYRADAKSDMSEFWEYALHAVQKDSLFREETKFLWEMIIYGIMSRDIVGLKSIPPSVYQKFPMSDLLAWRACHGGPITNHCAYEIISKRKHTYRELLFFAALSIAAHDSICMDDDEISGDTINSAKVLRLSGICPRRAIRDILQSEIEDGHKIVICGYYAGTMASNRWNTTGDYSLIDVPCFCQHGADNGIHTLVPSSLASCFERPSTFQAHCKCGREKTDNIRQIATQREHGCVCQTEMVASVLQKACEGRF
ncbi:hypothetical protein BKA57DRAFT_452279 [Linnemannia elongata]|nr:hypothetical protein BKA57DRAFT_452279 [Linnemannia elongata]